MPAPRPEAYNPPLTWWGHVWRTAVCLLISGLAWGEIAVAQAEEQPPLFWFDLAGGVAAFVLVFYRRRWPFAIALLLQVFPLFSVSSAGPSTLALVSLATRRQLGQIVAAGAIGVVTSQLFTYYQPNPTGDPPWVSFAFLIVITVALCVTGMYIGSRRELIWTLHERARQAEATQELRVEQARSAERERIAREMHDVLAHRISLVTMHAGALAYRTDLSADQVRETATLIQQKAHEALQDLRQVLGLLRADDSGEHRPQPVLADLSALAEEARQSGMTVKLEQDVAGDPGDRVGRTVYRIVQEGLTNARKHAGGAHVRVAVTGSPEDGVTVRVRNARPVGPARAPTPGAGLGLVGLRERAELAGGTLRVDDTTDGFVLTGWLPWQS